MSAYLTRAVPITDETSLVLALEAMGIPSSCIERSNEEQGIALQGFQGDARSQRAHVIVRRQGLSAASNDIGFERTPTGFQLHISAYDQQQQGARWRAELTSVYKRVHSERLEALAAVERQREEERRAEEQRKLVDAQRVAVIDRARKLGYQVKESKHEGNVRLVLCKRVF